MDPPGWVRGIWLDIRPRFGRPGRKFGWITLSPPVSLTLPRSATSFTCAPSSLWVTWPRTRSSSRWYTVAPPPQMSCVISRPRRCPSQSPTRVAGTASKVTLCLPGPVPLATPYGSCPPTPAWPTRLHWVWSPTPERSSGSQYGGFVDRRPTEALPCPSRAGILGEAIAPTDGRHQGDDHRPGLYSPG